MKVEVPLRQCGELRMTHEATLRRRGNRRSD
jgi:hypothetical protein